ncbi:MAG: RtcB family protein [Nitrospinae bacterium]|nr:RtcB family protein [Nitrospinota bacterium]
MNIKKLTDYKWEIEQDAARGMRVPGIIYADDNLMRLIEKDNSAGQVANGATLPGIVKGSMAMPDMHFGYGLPIGGVVATRMEDGVVSPGGTGYDINCGVRLLRTNLNSQEVEASALLLANELFQSIPTGVGSRGDIRLSGRDYRDVLINGARWAVERGYGAVEDIGHIEAQGRMEGADPASVGQKAMDRGKDQLGTLGSGNHFLEVQVVEEIFFPKAAAAFGLFPGQVTVMIHTGSRGFGHQVCTDYLQEMEKAVRKYGIELPDRQLACAPIQSPEGKSYLSAMRAAANYAWANRQCLAGLTERAFERILQMGPAALGMSCLYDVAHNIVKIEEHIIGGKKMRLAVHRKGATRSFPPHHPEVPESCKEVGQPVIIPGDMGRASYVLVGTQKAMEETFGSTCHGAGRLLSRHAAIRQTKGRAIERELGDKGIIVRSAGRHTLKEEAPEAYKNVTEVVNVVEKAGLSLKVARLRPIIVIKG